MAAFYRDRLGLEERDTNGTRTSLAPPGGAPLVHLVADPEAPRGPSRTVGLYHFALLLPDRGALAATVRGLAERGTSFVGFADHGVSEAAYLEDPEGNGVELYRDRPTEAWPRDGDEVAMVTDPLDADTLLSEADEPAGLPGSTRLGHVHLHAGDLERETRFFEQVGFRVTQSTYPGAMFLAAGEYHHHVGLNRWAGDRQTPEGATGLLRVDWTLPPGSLEENADGWSKEGLTAERDGRAGELTDPIGIRHRFTERG